MRDLQTSERFWQIKLTTMLKVMLLALTVSFVWLSVGSNARAQSITGDITGTITEATGSVVPSVNLTLTDQERNISFEAQTDATGNYLFTKLRPGKYTVTAEIAGFKKRVISDVVLNVNQRIRIDIAMEVGEITQTIEVRASAANVDTDNVALGQTIEEKTLVELPLNGRNFIELAKMSVGVVENTRLNLSNSWEGRRDQQVVVAGLANADVSFLLDGIESRSPRWGSAGFKPSIDSIQEFKMERNLFRANEGFGTTVVNITLKSGTNDLHGSAFEFLRNDVFDARNFFDRGDRPPFRQNQFGAFVGGPIKKDKLFFFGGYEGFRQRLSRTFVGLVPSPQQLQGDFSALSTPIIDWQTRQPFPNNIIPGNRRSVVGQNLAKLWPGPNVADPTLNYARAESNLEDADQFTVKSDYVRSQNDRMFFRYSYIDNPQNAPTLFPGEGVTRPLGDQNFAFNYSHVFSPTLVNEFKLGYNRNISKVGHESANGPDISAQVGLKNTQVSPGNEATPSVGVLGYSALGVNFNTTWDGVDNLYQIADNLSLIKGTHTIAFGFEGRQDRYYQRTDFPIAPTLNFNGVFSGNPVADFVLGLPNFSQASVGDSGQNMRGTYYGVYAQDDWKVNPKLTLSYGLRYEYITPWKEIDNKQRTLDLVKCRTAGSCKAIGPDGFREGVLFSGNQLPEGLPFPDRNNLAPRLGLAYSPFGADTVIRAGFGVYYTPSSHNEFLLRTLGYPFRDVATYNSFAPTPTVFLDELFPPLKASPNSDPQVINPNERSSYTMQWNLNIQKKVSDILLEVGYFGSGSHKVNERFNYNLARNDPTGVLTLQQRRPYPDWGDLLGNAAIGNASHHGLTFRAEKRFSSGFSLLQSYTLGKNLNDGEQDQYTHDSIRGGLGTLKGRSRIDQTHRSVTSFIYDLPFGKGKTIGGSLGSVPNAIVGGWQVNGIVTFSSGPPETVVVGGDIANIGARRIQTGNRLGDGNDSTLRSNIRENPTLFPYFRVQDFTTPTLNNLGNAGRGIINTPGINNWDISLFKNFQFNERIKVQFRAEFFNIWNHAQFAAPNMAVNSPTFGRITATQRDSRDIQLGLKILF